MLFEVSRVRLREGEFKDESSDGGNDEDSDSQEDDQTTYTVNQ